MADSSLPEGFTLDIPGQGGNQAPIPFEGSAALPEGFALDPPQKKDLTIPQRIMGRLLGTDVEDPLEIPRLAAILTGSISGGVMGSRMPRLPGAAGVVVNPVTGAMMGGVAGTIAGALSPETAIEMGEAAGIVEEGTRDRIGLSPSELKMLMENEALLDLATSGGFSALRLAGRGTARLLTGAGKEGMDLAERAAKHDIDLMPVQVGNRAIGRGYVAIMGRFPFIGASLRARGNASDMAVKNAFLNAPERIAPVASASEISEKIYNDAQTLLKETSKQFHDAYTEVFERAETLGVRVVPKATIDKANDVLKRIAVETPVTVTGEPTSTGKGLIAVKEFIEREVLPMQATEGGATYTAQQALRQMDGLMSKIDQEVAALEPSQRRFARSLMMEVRNAAQQDMLINVRGAHAGDIARELKALDTDFSHTMSSIFETATANRFGSVRKRGLRAAEFDETTRTPVDQLARVVLNLDSPQALDELSRLIKPETFKAVAAKTLDDAIQTATTKAGPDAGMFNVETFAQHLGIDRATGSRREVIATMLQKSGSPLSINDLDDLVAVGRAISKTEVPDVSTFIARRGTIGGIQAVITAAVPGIAIAGFGTYGAAPLLGMATMIGGGKLVSAILARPESARALKNVLDKEATTLVKRNATVKALRGGIEYMRAEDTISPEVYKQLGNAIDYAMTEFDRQLDFINGIELPIGQE